jgi:hypothetical protein
MRSPKFHKFANPKFIVYNYYLSIAELDRAKSETLIETI